MSVGRRLAVALPSPAPPPAPPPPPPPPPPLYPFNSRTPSLSSLMSSDFVHRPRYRCCCRVMHLKMASFIIGLIDILSMAAAFGRGLHLGLSMQHNPMAIAWFVISSLMFILGFMCTLSMFYGVWQERYLWMVPKLVMKISAIVLYSATTVGLVYVMMEHGPYLLDLVAEHVTKSDYEAARTAMRVGGGSLTVAFLLMALVHVWFFIVLCRCYKYLKDRYFWKQGRMQVEYESNHVTSLMNPAISPSPAITGLNQRNDTGISGNSNGSIRRGDSVERNVMTGADANQASDPTELNSLPLPVISTRIEPQCHSPLVLQSRSDRELLLCGHFNQTHV